MSSPAESASSPNLLYLINYFQEKAHVIAGNASSARIFDNTTDKGEIREIILRDFLEDHLPKKCEVIRGGFVFDFNGRKSKQLDLLITSDFTIQFKQRYSKAFNCLEGSLAAISVKSLLNEDSLYDAIDNLASIPTAKYMLEDMSADSDLRGLTSHIPFKVIFAYASTMSVDTLARHLVEKIKTKRLSVLQTPDLILVLNQCCISKKLPGNLRRGVGDHEPVGAYLVESDSKSIGGVSLLQLVSSIQTISNVTYVATMNFFKYESKANLDLAFTSDQPKKLLIKREQIYNDVEN